MLIADWGGGGTRLEASRVPVVGRGDVWKKEVKLCQDKGRREREEMNRLNVRNGGQRVRSLNLGRLDLIWSDQGRKGRRVGGATR